MLELTPNKRIDENLGLEPTFNNKISKNLYKKLKLTSAKKINKSLNKKLESSFIYNNIYIRKETIISIIKIWSKVYKLKTYNETIANLIYGIRWQQVIKKEIYHLEIYHN